MANAIYPSSQPIVSPSIRADLPKVIEVGPDLRDALVIVVGCALIALVAVALANYMMLPFGAG